MMAMMLIMMASIDVIRENLASFLAASACFLAVSACPLEESAMDLIELSSSCRCFSAMALKQSWKIIPMTEHYTVTKDADRLAPNWLASRINYKTIKLLYRDKDGHAELKGVKIGDEVAQIGDTVQFNGRRLSVGRR